MNIYENVTKKYFVDFKRVEPIEVNSSRLGDFKTCPELYRLKHVLGYKPKKNEIYLTWGGTVHKFFESLEILWAQKKYSNEAIVGLATIEAMKFWGDTKDPPVEDRKFGFMTKARLADLLLFASKRWIQEKADNTIAVLAAEKSFSIQLPNGMYVSGTPDQMIKWSGRILGRDLKTTTVEWKYYKRRLFPNDQFARYTYSESKLSNIEVSGQMIDVYYMTRDKGPTFNREIVTYTPEKLERWLKDQDYWKQALDYAREHDNYPQNEAACTRCPFHEVCASSSQAAKDYTLKMKYVYAPWDNIREGTVLLGES